MGLRSHSDNHQRKIQFLLSLGWKPYTRCTRRKNGSLTSVIGQRRSELRYGSSRRDGFILVPTFYPCPLQLSEFNVLREIGCWPWDVCAGIVIAEEAGGIVVGSHSDVAAASDKTFGDVTEEILAGRKYLVIRAIGDTEVRPCGIPMWPFLKISRRDSVKKASMHRGELSRSFTRALRMLKLTEKSTIISKVAKDFFPCTTQFKSAFLQKPGTLTAINTDKYYDTTHHLT